MENEVITSQEHYITRYTCEHARLQSNNITDINNCFIVNNNIRDVLLATTSQESHLYPKMGYIPICNSDAVAYQKFIECDSHTQTNIVTPNHRGGK